MVQILNQKSLWEQAFACEENPEAVNKLKSLLLERRVQGTSSIEMTASCLAQIDVCVPNIAPLVEDLCRVQPPDVDSGGLPPASLLQKLAVAKGVYSRQRRNGVTYIDLWVKKQWVLLRMTQVSDCLIYFQSDTSSDRCLSLILPLFHWLLFSRMFFANLWL